MTRTARLSMALVALLFVTGCAARSVHIAELKDRPGRYDDRSVSLTGVVTSSWGVPLMPYQFYSLSDGTGEIAVLSQSGRTPLRGARLQVTGRISEVAVVGGRSVGLHIQEEKRKSRN